MNTTMIPEPGDIAWPNDPVGRGHYVEVIESDDDWVRIRAHYPYMNTEPHERRIRLSTYLARYEQGGRRCTVTVPDEAGAS